MDPGKQNLDHWFEEALELKAGRVLKIGYKKHLDTLQSKFQKIDVYDTLPYGRMLVHDDVIMLTEFDEAHYHEMIVHVPMNVHPDPQRILIIGGGDGGTLREVLKYDCVKQVILCEIDAAVIEISKKYFPRLSTGFSHPKVEIINQDGAEFIRQWQNYFDLIIVDSSDPIGPAEVLFQENFYQDLHRALEEDGIGITQSESFLYHFDLIINLRAFSQKIFQQYYYYFTLVPTYPSGIIGFSFLSKKFNPLQDIGSPKTGFLKNLQYYNRDIHVASFVLPKSFSHRLYSK